jgi:hypothetical protein
MAEREGLRKASPSNTLDCLTSQNRSVDAIRAFGGLSNHKRDELRPGQGPLKAASSFRSGPRSNTYLEALRVGFPLGDKLEPVVSFTLNAEACFWTLRHFHYPVQLFQDGGRLRVEIGEPLFFDDAYEGGRDALRLVNRVLLWISKHEGEFATAARWHGIPIVDARP